ncbi:NACHT domain-containing protein [Vibrio harveyi]|uniref:NACHT domain-containing protein n=1 Tax=Vibrio harveyi TaxID=669 RepID=UPI0023809391|nr:NACHT domain-containing protein [Vibrio harveyi]
MEIETIASGGISAGKGTLTGDIYKFTKSLVRKKIVTSQFVAQLQLLMQNSSQVKNVKTFWHLHEEINLHEFYYPTKVRFGSQRFEINSLNDIKYKGSILFSGIAGQGKSMFMRYLCSNSADDANVLPLFIEARKTVCSISLEKSIFEAFLSLGAGHIDEDIMISLSKSNKVVLFIDGFDEIPEGKRPKFVSDLEQLKIKYRGVRIILSSRPNTGAESLEGFRVYSLDYLTFQDQDGIIKKLCTDNEVAIRLLDEISNSNSNIRQIISTPLIATLVVLLYNTKSTLPISKHHLFEEIFDVMYEKHDTSKLMYRREKKCAIHKEEFRKAFSYFCYISKVCDVSIFNDVLAIEMASDSLDHSNLKLNATDFFDDILNASSLIVKDGADFSFIHKSIQDYFSAVAISNCYDTEIDEWYRSLVFDNEWFYWIDELYYLDKIDSIRFNQFIGCHSVLYIDKLLDDNIYLSTVYSDFSISIEFNSFGGFDTRVSTKKCESSIVYYFFYQDVVSLVLRYLDSSSIKSSIVLRKNSVIKKMNVKSEIFLLDLLKIIGKTDEFDVKVKLLMDTFLLRFSGMVDSAKGSRKKSNILKARSAAHTKRD